MSYEFVSLHGGVDEVSVFLWYDIVSQALVTNISWPLCHLGIICNHIPSCASHPGRTDMWKVLSHPLLVLFNMLTCNRWTYTCIRHMYYMYWHIFLTVSVKQCLLNRGIYPHRILMCNSKLWDIHAGLLLCHGYILKNVEQIEHKLPVLQLCISGGGARRLTSSSDIV